MTRGHWDTPSHAASRAKSVPVKRIVLGSMCWPAHGCLAVGGGAASIAPVWVLHIDGADRSRPRPATSSTASADAQDAAAQAVLITMDTPGGSMSSMQDIIKAFFASKVPDHRVCLPGRRDGRQRGHVHHDGGGHRGDGAREQHRLGKPDQHQTRPARSRSIEQDSRAQDDELRGSSTPGPSQRSAAATPNGPRKPSGKQPTSLPRTRSSCT